MGSVFWLPVAAASLFSIVAPAQAMPIASSQMVSEASITFVRDGCGPFGHRSHYGYCKENGDGWGGYDRGGYGDDGGHGYGAYGFVHRRGFYDQGGYGERRCFIQETDDGPVRVCR